MAKSKVSRKLDVKKPDKLPPFSMAEPNDDAGAFGWSLDRLRYPSKDSTKKDVWPGRSVFEIAEAPDLVDAYGFNIDFVNAKFVQVMLDQSVAVREAAQECARKRYSAAARADLRDVIMTEFRKTILPAILARFKKVAPLVADFYAARLAALMTYGADAAAE